MMRSHTFLQEYLAAFAIAFAIGILPAATIVAYLERGRRNAVRDRYKRAASELTLPTISSANIKEIK